MSKCPFHNSSSTEEKPVAKLDAVTNNTAGDEETSTTTAKKCPYASSDSGPGKAWQNASSDELKQHFVKAYNQVAESARNKNEHNYKVAKVLGEQLGYSEDELKVIGDDVWMMQGTGNPHSHAEIKPGEFVVDLGSGFGLDAFVAGAKVGPTGRVVGIDLAGGEVLSALERCNKRGLRNVDFRLGDIENPPFEDNSVDAVLSNGGFCLVPDKFKAFKEIFRILKSGGNSRMAISCTVRTKMLDDSKKWPSCFVAFASIEKILPWLDEIGFKNCSIDRSNSDVDIWELSEHHENASVKEGTDNATANANTNAGSGENKCPFSGSGNAGVVDLKTGTREGSGYEHLKNMVMSEYFQRVTIVARKP